VPDLRIAAEQEHRDCALTEAARNVRPDHHPVAGQPVGPDAADEEEQHLRQRPRREDVPKVGLRSGQVEDGERERDVRERAPDEGGRSAEEEESERALP
jgi:hypothetical protein